MVIKNKREMQISNKTQQLPNKRNKEQKSLKNRTTKLKIEKTKSFPDFQEVLI